MKRLVLILLLVLNVFIIKINAQDDLNDGFNMFYYPNTKQVSSEGFIKEGKPDGYWKTYYVTGIVKSEGLRTNFQLDSTWTFYNQSGEITERINYKYDKRNGYSYKYSYLNSTEPITISKELYVNDKKEGKSFYYFNNGKVREEINYIDGKREGQSREYNEKGDIITLSEYHNNYIISRIRINRLDAQGRKQGTWMVFYLSGKVHKEMKYLDDKLDGLYKEFSENGNLILSFNYKDGKVVEDQTTNESFQNIDFRREVNDKGILISSGSYLKDKPVGLHRYFDEKGKIVNGMIFDETGSKLAEGLVDETGSREGEWKDYYASGELKSTGLYKGNLQTGRWTFYYKNGRKEQEGSYLRGLYDGKWTWYYDNGNIWREETYFNGREDGESIEYDQEGNIITKGDYINGEKEGKWFYKINDHTEEGNYQTGLRSGIWKYYYEDGILQFEGEFVQDLAEGKHKFYYPNGILAEERFYIRGVREKNWKKYDENGILAMTITYRNDQEYRINGVKLNLPRGSIQTIK